VLINRKIKVVEQNYR